MNRRAVCCPMACTCRVYPAIDLDPDALAIELACAIMLAKIEAPGLSSLAQRAILVCFIRDVRRFGVRRSFVYGAHPWEIVSFSRLARQWVTELLS